MTRLRQSPSAAQLRLVRAADMPRGPSETVIKAQILKALSRIPYCLFVNTPSGKLQVNGGWFHAGAKGWPDLSGVVEKFIPTIPGQPYRWLAIGVPVYLEVKRDGGKLSGDQVAMHERLMQLGARVFVVRSVREAVAAVQEVRGA